MAAQRCSDRRCFVKAGLMDCPAETYGRGSRVDLSAGVRIGSPHGLVRMCTNSALASRFTSPRLMRRHSPEPGTNHGGRG